MCDKDVNFGYVGQSTQSIRTTLRDRLQEIIRHCKEARLKIDNEEIQAEKALDMLNKNKQLETLIDLIQK